MLFIGPPGVGKTMLSISLPRPAAQAGRKASFTTCDDLIHPRRRAIAEQRPATGPRFFVQPHLLLIDEFGYRRLDEDGHSLLSEVINARYLKGSAITTSHVGINGWGERLGDAMLAAAFIDRVLHRGIIVGTTACPAGCAPTRPAPTSCVPPSPARTSGWARAPHRHPLVRHLRREEKDRQTLKGRGSALCPPRLPVDGDDHLARRR